MKTLGDLNRFTLGTLGNEDAGRIALYHYIKNFNLDREPLSPQSINTFFMRVLTLPYWQEKQKELAKDISELLRRFLEQNRMTFQIAQLLKLEKLQLVQIQNQDDLVAIVKKAESRDNVTCRVFQFPQNGALAICRNQDGSLEVRTYLPTVLVQGSQLVPLSPDQELTYDSSLNLELNKIHLLRISPHHSVRLKMTENEIETKFYSGFAFRLSQELKIQDLKQDARIFYAIKKLERYFVMRTSDPYYVELLEAMGRAKRLVSENSKNAADFARKVFEEGQIAFDQLYSDDRQLHGHLKELAKFCSVPHSSPV